jgi:hypothetical protein
MAENLFKIFFFNLPTGTSSSFYEKGEDPDPDPDPYLRLMDPDSDPGGPKTCGSRSPTLLF